jgi:hypothetical protein
MLLFFTPSCTPVYTEFSIFEGNFQQPSLETLVGGPAEFHCSPQAGIVKMETVKQLHIYIQVPFLMPLNCVSLCLQKVQNRETAPRRRQ